MEILKNVPLDIKVCGDFDVCVIGGGTAGTFAAIRAARLGARTAIVEKGNCFGGVACAGLVNIWHSLYDTDFKKQIIAGLTDEAEQRLLQKDAAVLEQNDSCGMRFDPNALRGILDDLVVESGAHVFFHSSYTGVLTDGNALQYALISNKDGLCAVKAAFFIDASGDGDVMRDLKMPGYLGERIQPPSSCFFLQGNTKRPLTNW